MNIFILTIYYPDNLSYEVSQTKAVHYLAKYLVENNRVMVMHNRIVNSPLLQKIKKEKKPENFISEYEVIDKVEVIRNNLINCIPRYTVLTNLSIKKAINNTITKLKEKNFEPDVIVVHFCWQQRGVITHLKRLFNVPIIPIFHNIDIKYIGYCKKMVKKFPYAGARSKRIKEQMIGCGYREENVFIVNSGFPLFEQSDILNKKLSSSNCGKFVFAGNLIKIKRVNDVISAMSLLMDKYDISFEIIGDGIEKENLIALCEQSGMADKVVFCGRLSREETLKKMKTADCFIMTSSPETFGITYIEAMACKCFVIGSKGEGIDGIIVDGVNGLLAVPGNIESIKEKLECFLSMPEDAKMKMVEKGFITAQDYGEEKVSGEYLFNIMKGKDIISQSF